MIKKAKFKLFLAKKDIFYEYFILKLAKAFYKPKGFLCVVTLTHVITKAPELSNISMNNSVAGEI
jgi:hypothetical protein